MNMRASPLIFAAAMAVAGCGDVTSAVPQTTELRLVNAVVNLNTTTAPGNEIDILIDSSTAPPGTEKLAMNTARDYAELSVGIHSYVARISGLTPPGSNLFRVLLRSHFTGAARGFTMYVVGINPATGEPAASAIQAAVIFDDRFVPRTVNGTLQARFKVVNVAPYASGPTGTGAQVNIYLSPGTTPLSTVANLAPQTSSAVFFRSGSAYVNAAAGDYVLTLATTAGVVLKSVPVSLGSGDVRTFVLMNTGPVVAPATAGPGNHTIMTLVDADF